jgi:TRAP-type C4-dicarboxylate transport system substrate-binding protein
MLSLAIGASALLLIGCGSGAHESASSSRPASSDKPESLTLRLADSNSVTAWTAFAQHVDEVSNEHLHVEVSPACCGRAADVEQGLVTAVAAGTFDIGVVATRVFAELGVTSFQALTTPFLIDSYSLEHAVLTSEIPAKMLAGLDLDGVTGLAVLPGPLRRPISADKPLLAVDDWKGQTVHVFGSAISADAISALGATPTTVGFDERDKGIAEGTITAVENAPSFQSAGRQEALPYLATNVALWPGTSALIANTKLLSRLSQEQIGWLRAAAADTIARTDELAQADADTLAANCRVGARYADATSTDLSAMRDAVAPVIAQLEHDNQTKAFINRIGEIARTVTPEPSFAIPPNCAGQAPSHDAGTDDTSVLNGTYQSVTWTVDTLVKAGVTPQEAGDVAGTFTFTFDNGLFELSHHAASGETFGCKGSYSISGNRVSVRYEAESDCGSTGGELFNAIYERSDRTLHLTDIVAGHATDEVLFGTEPWTEVD